MSKEISEEDMRGLNSKESTILTRNLSSGEALIPQQEIIAEVAQLRTLGNMAESLVRFQKPVLCALVYIFFKFYHFTSVFHYNKTLTLPVAL